LASAFKEWSDSGAWLKGRVYDEDLLTICFKYWASGFELRRLGIDEQFTLEEPAHPTQAVHEPMQVPEDNVWDLANAHGATVALEPPSDLYTFNLQREQGSMFTTSNGLLGFAPGPVAEGDVIVLLRGVRCPAVLRRCSERWTFRGVVYLSGMEQGELTQALEGIDLPMEDYVLC